MSDRLEDEYVAGVVLQLCDRAATAWTYDRIELAERLFNAAVSAIDGAEFIDDEAKA